MFWYQPLPDDNMRIYQSVAYDEQSIRRCYATDELKSQAEYLCLLELIKYAKHRPDLDMAEEAGGRIRTFVIDD